MAGYTRELRQGRVAVYTPGHTLAMLSHPSTQQLLETIFELGGRGITGSGEGCWGVVAKAGNPLPGPIAIFAVDSAYSSRFSPPFWTVYPNFMIDNSCFMSYN